MNKIIFDLLTQQRCTDPLNQQNLIGQCTIIAKVPYIYSLQGVSLLRKSGAKCKIIIQTNYFFISAIKNKTQRSFKIS